MPATARVKPSMGCAYVVVLLLAGIGVWMLIAAASAYARRGRVRESTAVQAVIGVVLCIGASAYTRYARKTVRNFELEERRRAEFVHEPWKWRQEWCEPVIKSKDGAGVGLTWFLAVCVCGISAPVVYALFTRPDIPKPVYLALIFPVIGVTLVGSAVYKTLQWRKFGPTQFILSTLPGSIGGYLGGVIEVPARVTLEKDAGITLRCVRRVTTGAGKNRHTSEHTIWEREERIPAEKWLSGSGRTEIPVLFHIPAGQPSTDLDTPDNQVIWRLSASGEVPGVDFETSFDVPVFETGETVPPPPAGEPALDVYRPRAFGGAELDGAALERTGITRQAGSWHFESRHLWVPKVISAMVALGLTWLLWAFVGNNVHWVPWVVAAMFALIAWLMAIDLWFARCELRIEGEDVVVRESHWRGPRERRVSRADVAEIRAERSMSVGATQYHRLLLVGRSADPSGPPAVDEPFRTRKVRYQIRQLGRELGVERPEQMGARGAELLQQLAAAPRFEIVFAKHVPGSALAEAVSRMVLAEVRGGR